MDVARERIREKRFSEAILLLQSEVREHPDDDVSLLLARVLSWDRRYEESLGEYRRILERHPNDGPIHAGYAKVLAWSGRHEDAIREYRRAIASDSTNLETRIDYARALSWSGDIAGASDEYGRILDRNPHEGDAWLGLAAVARWRGATTASGTFLARAEQFGADSNSISEERTEVRAALLPSIGGGWNSSHERQYVPGPDFTLDTEGPFVEGRGTIVGAIGISGRVAWLTLKEVPASDNPATVPNYDLRCAAYSADASLLRGYPWQGAFGAEYRTFEPNGDSTTYPLNGDDDFFGWTARLWRYTGRFTPRVNARRSYVPSKDERSDGTLVFHPGSLDDYDAGLSFQWSGRGGADGLVSRGVYSDDNRRWTAGGNITYRVRTRVPTVTPELRLTYRDWDTTSANYFTPLGSLRGAAGISIGGYAEHLEADYGFRYEFSGLSSSNFADIWAHSWSGFVNATVLGKVPLGFEAAYSLDNNSYETWSLGFSGSTRW